MTHKVYAAIITAVREKKLNESFTSSDVHRACPELNTRTPGILLSKHAKDNPKGYSEMFEKIGRGPFRLLWPIKCGR